MKRVIYSFLSLWMSLAFMSCEQFVEIDPPISDLIRETVFNDDQTAERAVLGIYSQMANNTSFARGDVRSISYLASLSSDDLVNYSTSLEMTEFANNKLLPANSMVLGLWSTLYQTIYQANAVVEGLNASSKISVEQKTRLAGEAKFIRAFCHFYLVNLWGDAPLVLTTDYRTNTNIPRTDKSTVYQQIIIDLKDAQASLPNINGSKLRPSKEAATALLARAYLYVGDWANAEIQATSIIDNLKLETDLNKVFLTTSTEAIWQLASNNVNSADGRAFIFASKPVNGALRRSLVDSFEAGDRRKTNWVGSRIADAQEFFFPYKYKAMANTPVTEYSMVIRVAEQYLIRAEALAQQNKLENAQTDVNVIRNRAGLGNTTASTQEELLEAIEHERKVELFAEWGHRWLDLKRTDRLNDILGPTKPDWKSTSALYPIPDLQVLNNPAMANAQNPGY